MKKKISHAKCTNYRHQYDDMNAVFCHPCPECGASVHCNSCIANLSDDYTQKREAEICANGKMNCIS